MDLRIEIRKHAIQLKTFYANLAIVLRITNFILTMSEFDCNYAPIRSSGFEWLSHNKNLATKTCIRLRKSRTGEIVCSVHFATVFCSALINLGIILFEFYFIVQASFTKPVMGSHSCRFVGKKLIYFTNVRHKLSVPTYTAAKALMLLRQFNAHVLTKCEP